MEHNVLWTGGWDSTFRVLDLILNKDKVVQPYYIVDKQRKSTEMELKTMQKIREEIFAINKTNNNLKELIIIDKDEIPDNYSITKKYKTLVQQSHLGGQYDWLARYCNANNIIDLELCIHLDDTVEAFIKNDVSLINEENDLYYILNDTLSQDELTIFSYYHFPLFKYTKLDMERISITSNFNHIMEETWFCHSPINNQPCGMCNPCKYTVEEGLGRRVPKINAITKLKRKLQQLLLRLKIKK